MHIRRLITLLLGIYLSSVAIILYSDALSAKVATATVKAPPAEAIKPLAYLGETLSEQVLRYAASESNRRLTEHVGTFQIFLVIGIAVMLFLSHYSRKATIIAAIWLLAEAGTLFLLTPQLVAQGRLLDFRVGDMLLSERDRMVNLQNFSYLLAGFRSICCLIVSGILLHRGDASRYRRRKSDVQVVDNPDHSHVNG